jgi:hypothetical protein
VWRSCLGALKGRPYVGTAYEVVAPVSASVAGVPPSPFLRKNVILGGLYRCVVQECDSKRVRSRYHFQWVKKQKRRRDAGATKA